MLVLAALLAAGPGWAQDAEPESQLPDAGALAQADEGIVVTGSRIVRNGFNAPTPLTVVGSELIENLGQVNVAETLRLIPQNSNFQSDSVAGITAGSNVGASFGNLRGLNPFNGTRTLTLVNSRRFVPTSDGGAVDLNIIPSAMIQRIETVTGGASAAYGSDAISGVINIILETDLDGIKAQVDYGQTFRNDGKSYHASLIYGTQLGSRGHIVIGGEYQDNRGIGDCSEVRLWCAEGWDIYGNSGNILRNGQTSGYNVPGSPGDPFPNFVIGPDSKQAFNDPRGVVRADARTNPAARYYRFTDDGLGIVQYDPGMFVSAAQIGPRQGGDGVSTYDDSDIQTPLERYVGYLYGTYEVFDGINFETELTYANRTASNTSYLTGPRSTFYVNPDNPFIPPALSALLNGTQFSLGKDLDTNFQSVNEAEAKVFRGLVGLNGKIGADWSWNVYYQYGENKRHQDRTYNRVNTLFQYALDAVRAPNGEIVCRELLKASPDPRAQGCKPMNLFGLNNVDPAAIEYVYRPVVEDFKYTQHVLSGSVQGNLYDGWGAGPIGFAAGADYRDEEGDVTHGDIPFYNDYAFTFGLDFAGKINVIEGFGEVNVPVFRDWALGELFELNGAVRYTRNKSTDTLTGEEKTTKATTWKVSAIYDVIGGLRLRGSRSRDFRAAGFRELFNKQVRTEPGSTSGIVDNPAIPGSPLVGDDPTPILNGGSFALEPEKADTTTLGAVYSPTFVSGLRFSIDWYQIKIGNAIALISAQQIVNFCRDYEIFCDRITYGASPADITFIDARQLNLSRLTLRGFDLELDYRLRLADVSSALDGQLNLRALGTRQYDFVSQATPATLPVDGAGQSGPVGDGGNFNASPPWTFNGFVSYDNAGFNVTTNIRHIPKGKYRVDRTGPEDEGYDPNLPNSINTNRVQAATYVSLAMTYRMPLGSDEDRHVELFGVIDNLFDKKPPIAPGGGGGGGSNYPTNPVYFDTFGARFRTGVRVAY